MIEELLKYLEKKYDQAVTFINYLIGKYGGLSNSYVLPDNTDTSISDEKVDEAYLTFKCDSNVNVEIINKLTNSMLELKKDLNQDNSVATKIVDKYIQELYKLAKYSDIDDGEKVAEKYINILKKTIIKLWENKKMSKDIRRYFDRNHIQVKEFEEGHKLSDDDFEELDENLIGAYGVDTDCKSDKYKVIEMVFPIVKVYFEDENGENNFALLSGCCKYYM